MNAGLRKLGGLVAVAVCAALLPLPAGAATGVDLNLYYDTPVIAPGGHGMQVFEVADSGAAATAPAELDLALPAFVRLAAGLPAACQIRYVDPDPAVPEVVQCTLGVLAAGTSATFPLPLSVDGAAPTGSLWGSALAMPAPADQDANMSDNMGPMSVVVNKNAAPAGPATGTGNAADLYLSTDLPPLAPGSPRAEHFVIGNRGPDPMSGPADLVMTPPPLVRIEPDRPLPRACAFLYDDPDPALPQVLRCALPRRLSGRWQETRSVPLAVVPGAPVQTVWGTAEVYPDRTDGSNDTDPLQQNNLVESGAQIVG